MKRLLPFLLCWNLLFSVPSLATDMPPPERWTARNAVAFVLRNNPDGQSASQRLREAQALYDKSAASFYPQLDLGASYSQTNNPMYSFGNILNQGQFTPAIDFNDPGRTDNLSLRAGVEYRFYNGGQDSAAKQAAEAGVELSAAARESLLRGLEFEALRSFQRIVESESIAQARQAALAQIESSLVVARARYTAGDLLRIDLLNLEVEESRARENQIEAEHNLQLSRQIFLSLLGLDGGEVILSPQPAEEPAPPQRPSPDQRPELQQLRAALRAGEAQLRAAKGSRRPTVDGFASYQYDQGRVLDGDGDSWLAGVKIDFKLFDGRSTAADISVAEARLGALRAALRKLELALELEIMQAELALSQAQQRRKVTTRMLAQATESEQLSRARFREGVILAADLIDVETRLTDARVRNAVAISAARVAIADLRRASGLSQFPSPSISTVSGESP